MGQVVQFRQPANDTEAVALHGREQIRAAWIAAKAAHEAAAPSQAEVATLIIAAVALSLPKRAADKVRRRLNQAYVSAMDPVWKETARRAAEAMAVL